MQPLIYQTKFSSFINRKLCFHVRNFSMFFLQKKGLILNDVKKLAINHPEQIDMQIWFGVVPRQILAILDPERHGHRSSEQSDRRGFTP